MPAPVDDQGLEVPTRNLQYAYDHPPHVVTVDGEQYSVQDPLGDREAAINFSSGGYSTSNESDVREVVEAAAGSHREITVQLFIDVLPERGFPYQNGQLLVIEEPPGDLPFLGNRSWRVVDLSYGYDVDGDEPRTIALLTSINLQDLYY